MQASIFTGSPSATQPITLPDIGRAQLPSLFREAGYTTGAEIGVWQGAFSALLCQANPDLSLLCVDPWEPHEEWLSTKPHLSTPAARAFMAESYAIAKTTLAPYRCEIRRAYSVDAAKDVADQSLDFVYIDGSHQYDAVMADLEAWVPKVRSGGVVSGHDYRRFPNKPGIHVVDAVNDYTTAHQIAPWFVLAAQKTPSFAWVVR